jgi:phosphohistidine phosphatase
MKHLFLLRHAKSDWGNPALSDLERPLNRRGLEAAPLIGRVLGEQRARPTFVWCSPAARTRETARLTLVAAKLDVPVRFDERIYEASVQRLLEVASETEDEHETFLLIGHNPGLSELLMHLTHDVRAMPTAALAVISLEIDSWVAIDRARGRLEVFVKPRDLEV